MRLFRVLPIVAALFFAQATLAPQKAHAIRIIKSFGLSGIFYTGKSATSITPPYAGGLAFSAYLGVSNWFYLKHRFGFEGMMGEKFGAAGGAFFGAAGTYDFSLRVNLAKGNFVPYLEGGALLGIFVMQLASPPDGYSVNQGALKYGYIVGTGVDWMGVNNGFGINVSYFKYLPSPAMFEFPYTALDAKGVRLEFKWLFQGT